jgi:hypothetical protein
MSTENTCFSKSKMSVIAQCQSSSINLIVLLIFVHPSRMSQNAIYKCELPVPNAPNAHE